ncbi:hypothetical protein [Frigoribacterium sp. CG_9.8]|uniref:hypothetical protein n=1 Tax=Frigoribacterium sp. CG_9.8 TaxID=2787733 RepID=UPI0018C9462E|nr:hypothetical protein [Frigoribacterium sp. CG_9.8]MBG6109055.1 hypothetical protein [Frigoribacterium sp. CG_9.8]
MANPPVSPTRSVNSARPAICDLRVPHPAELKTRTVLEIETVANGKGQMPGPAGVVPGSFTININK